MKNNEMELHKNDYSTIAIDNTKSFIEIHLSEDTLLDRHFIGEIKTLKILVENHRVKALLLDLMDTSYPIQPAAQEWLSRIFEKLGIALIAIVKPDDFVANLSIQQAMSLVSNQIDVEYFDYYEAAYDWLCHSILKF